MGNFKVKVNTPEESREAQELFEAIGYKKGACSLGNYPAIIVTTQDWATGDYCSTRALGLDIPAHENYKEITLPELRDMVNPPLNDQYAEIEQARQAIKLGDGNDSNHTADAMAYAFMGVGRDKVRQHQHYFIDVSDVDEIDFYEIALRYNVTDPCIQHILKKCLAVGQRGQKDFHHDLKDIYDTAKRMLDVHGLDS